MRLNLVFAPPTLFGGWAACSAQTHRETGSPSLSTVVSEASSLAQ